MSLRTRVTLNIGVPIATCCIVVQKDFLDVFGSDEDLLAKAKG